MDGRRGQQGQTIGQQGREGAASGTQRRGAVGPRDSGVAALGTPAGPSSLLMDGGGPDPHTSWRPALHTHSRSPTSLRVRLNEDSEVDDAGGEVKGCLLAVVDDRDAVAVPIAGPWHATLEDGEGQPGRHRRAGGGLLTPPQKPRAEPAVGWPCDWPLQQGLA